MTSFPPRIHLPLLAAGLALLLTGCGAGGALDALGSAIDDAFSGSGSGGGGGGTGDAVQPPGEMSDAERAAALAVLALVNEERADAGLWPLVWDEQAATAAYAHAYDMDARDYFDHYSPEGVGPAQRMAAAGVVGDAWGENIAWGQPTPEDVMDDWMGSSGHRSNILSVSFDRIGIGVHVGAGTYWVQDFVGD
jgi:uncharacterized protein YkwD